MDIYAHSEMDGIMLFNVSSGFVYFIYLIVNDIMFFRFKNITIFSLSFSFKESSYRAAEMVIGVPDDQPMDRTHRIKQFYPFVFVFYVIILFVLIYEITEYSYI